MKKLYAMHIVFDNGHVIYGPIIGQDDIERFKKLVRDYHEMTVLRLNDGWRDIVIPKDMIQRSYVEFRRISWVRFLCRIILRRVDNS